MPLQTLKKLHSQWVKGAFGEDDDVGGVRSCGSLAPEVKEELHHLLNEKPAISIKEVRSCWQSESDGTDVSV